jgi:AAA domain-containing protein
VREPEADGMTAALDAPQVIAARKRLADEDPDGEADALAPLPPAQVRIAAEWRDLNESNERRARITGRWPKQDDVDARPWPQPASEVDPSGALEDEYLVDGVIRPGRLMVLASTEGLGKSHARGEIAMRLATGHGALFDHYRVPGSCRVLTFDVENGDEEELRREEEIRERLGISRADLTDYWRVSLEGLSLADPADQAYILAAVAKVRPSLAIFDTGSSMVGDEWGQPLKDAIRFLRLVARQYGCAVLVVVHLTKPSRQAKPGKDQPQHGTSLADVMGQWTRQADSVALMADAGADRVKWSMRKRVPHSTLVLERTEGTFHAVQVIAGEDLGVGTTNRVFNAIASGATDAPSIHEALGLSVRTVRRHVAVLRRENRVSQEGPYRIARMSPRVTPLGTPEIHA